ncbi:MAG: ATP-dependent DNA helicase RecG, partial [Deltaproteobacteria bacterium]|nr:ATP-dependent DNA helicase RecG [Deltaproteobacteria bacterium]
MARNAPLTSLPRVGPRTAEKLATVGVSEVEHLLTRLPRGYEDRSQITLVADLVPGDVAVVLGRIVAVRQGRRRGRRPGMLEARVDDGSAALTVLFFQPPPYVAKAWTKGRHVLVMGRTEAKPPLRLTHPEVELDPAGAAGNHAGSIVPFYGTPEGMGQRAYRSLVHAAFEAVGSEQGLLPDDLRRELGLPRRADALRSIHHPATASDLPSLRAGTHPAHEALLLEDLFVLQVALRWRRHRLASQGSLADQLPRARMGGPRGRATVRARAETALPFTLTEAQQRVLGEVDSDLVVRGRPMQRLVQGDVGAGKTVVGLLAAAPMLERGGQVAVLAPTEVLARQWQVQAKALYEPLGFGVAWLAGGQGAADRRAELERVARGGAALVVGTHALFSEGVRFHRLSMAIVDEQQRFGVYQRARLLAKGPQPHLLALSATPIPRSLARTLFGDLDLSLLDEGPPRGPRTTEILPSARRRHAWERVRAAVEAGGRAFVVCPRIEGPAGDVLRSALATAEELANGALAGLPLGVLHGGMDSASKAAVLGAFRAGHIGVLVSTTVIEVGVDVPEASVMVVENAERFGLGQLHQLRGRVGRNADGGHCVLLTPAPDDADRLAILAETDDGFAVAEEDLRRRGPGDLVGARQAGRPAFRLAMTPRFSELLGVARRVAEALVQRGDFTTDARLGRLREAATD